MPQWPRTPKYFAAAEYWLYLPRPKLPPQAAIMQRMMRVHPFAPGEPPPCGHNEGLIFSDIRFHIGLVLREKNVHVFRPDLFESHIVADSVALEALAQSVALAKLQYVSDVRLKDDRHLQFLVYMVEALSHLTRGALVFDTPAERIWHIADLKARLQSDTDATRSELHVQSYWQPEESGGRAFSRGLRKIGFPEFATPLTGSDHESIVRNLVEAAALQVWEDREFRKERTLTAFGDTFRADIQFRGKSDAQMRISRITGG